MSATPSLRDLQLWLKWIITDPRGVTEALYDPTPSIEKYKERYTRPTPSYLGHVVSDSLGATDRLDVYAEGYFSRISECIGKDFSRTKKVVGEEAFTKLVAEYLKAFPSRFTSIDEVGYRFANFISEYDGLELNGWVADLALFEWNWIESFYENDVVAFPNWRNELGSNPRARVQVHPSVRLIQSQSPIGKLIRTLDSGDEIDTIEVNKRNSYPLLIYRFNDEVYWEELDQPAFEILQNLKNGTPFEEALSQAHGVDPQVVSTNFSRWVERGILCGVIKERNEVSL